MVPCGYGTAGLKFRDLNPGSLTSYGYHSNGLPWPQPVVPQATKAAQPVVLLKLPRQPLKPLRVSSVFHTCTVKNPDGLTMPHWFESITGLHSNMQMALFFQKFMTCVEIVIVLCIFFGLFLVYNAVTIGLVVVFCLSGMFYWVNIWCLCCPRLNERFRTDIWVRLLGRSVDAKTPWTLVVQQRSFSLRRC